MLIKVPYFLIECSCSTFLSMGCSCEIIGAYVSSLLIPQKDILKSVKAWLAHLGIDGL